MKLRTFFNYFGGKWRMARHYPDPRHDTIIEPFAGAAGYSLHWPERRVILCDADEHISGLWRYLIRVSESEIRSLPDVPAGTTTDDMRGCCQEARWLAGFWLNQGAAAPMKSPSAWARSGIRQNRFWCAVVRERIAAQLQFIRHWDVLDDYRHAPDVVATWFIDPPYQVAGIHYRKGAKTINYEALGAWCRERRGQVMVCENAGADWLPFVPIVNGRGATGARRSGRTDEVVWHPEAQEQRRLFA